MAYQYLLDEEEDESSPSPQGGQALGTLGSNQGGSLVTGNEPPAAANEGEGTASGSFTNLQSYLDANQQRDFGSQVAGNVQGSVDEARNQQQIADTSFRGDVDASTVRTNQELLDQLSNPSSILDDPDSFQRFKDMRDAKYDGPNSLVTTDYYQPAYEATSKANQELGASKSESGRMELLDQYYGSGAGRHNYSAGEKKLDNLLVQNDPNSREAFQQLQESGAGVGDEYEAIQRALEGYAGEARSTTQGTRDKTRQGLGIDDAGNVLGFDDTRGNAGRIQDVVEGLDARSAEYGSEQQTAYDSALETISTGRGTSEMEQYGLQGQRYYNLNPTDYLQSREAPTRSTVASQDDRSEIDALSQLAGVNQSFVNSDAGFYERGNHYDFDAERMRRAAQAEEAGYNDYLNDFQFQGDLGGASSDNILGNQSLTEDQKLSQLAALSKGTRAGGGDQARNVEGWLNEYNRQLSDPEASMIRGHSWRVAYRDRSQKILDMLRRAKGYNNIFQ